MRHLKLLLGLCGLLSFLAASSRAAVPPQLWLYYPTNLAVDKNIDDLEKICSRAASAGYTHLMIADSKFARLESLPDSYFKNVQRVKQIAARLKLDVSPAVFPIGYSNDLLWHDPNLAEGLPVKDQLFVVSQGEARPQADPPVSLDRLGFKDDNVKIADRVATFLGGDVHSRFNFQLKVSPYRCYHVAVKIRSKNLVGEPQIVALAGESGLNFQNLRVKPTQDWTQHDIVFNSLDHDQVLLYFGVWAEMKGELQWKDWSIEEAGPVNILRRDGTPLVVKLEQSGKQLAEGTDFDKLVDSKLGATPWSGEYDSWHEAPTLKTHLPDGTRLRVSWYHPAIIYDEQVAACISEPKTMALIADQAQRMKKLWDASLYVMSHDEFRTFGWDESCQARHQTPGQMLAENARQCTSLLAPARAGVWGDMFDPYHNAVKGPYYLVNGPWSGSWEGVDPKVVIFNWNYGKRDESLKFFADRGHEQVIAGFYDNDLSDWQNWLNSAAKVHGVIGYMYTTWRNDYSALEKFAQMSH